MAGLLALAPAALAGADGFELRGVLIENGTTRFSIHERASASSAWLTAGQRLPDLVVIEGHDNFGCVVEIGGVRHILTLPQVRLGDTDTPSARHGPAAASGQTASANAENTSRARQAREVGRLSSDAVARTSPEATVSGRQAARPTANTSPSFADAPVTPAAQSYTPLLGRKVNRVNSRVHASDHIEQFGPPPSP